MVPAGWHKRLVLIGALIGLQGLVGGWMVSSGLVGRMVDVASYRLAMHKAGLGIYGRFGVCIHPEYGCYFRVGVLLTDAELAPTKRDDLANFNPCEGCSLCADVCPVHAIDATKSPAEGYNRELCMRFILTIKKRHKSELDIDPYGVKVCNRCFGICPYAKTKLN